MKDVHSPLTAALRDQGSPGVHLHVLAANRRAVAFYRHVGFTELPSEGVHLFVMDLRQPNQPSQPSQP